MRWPPRPTRLLMVILLFAGGFAAASQRPTPAPAKVQDPSAAPLPDVNTLLADVERNQKHLEVLQRDYTYHVHLVRQELDKNGGVKKDETEDAESLTVEGVRVDKVVARNGRPLTPDEQKKESERIDKEVAKAKERQARLEAKGALTDQRGNEVMPLSRILELGTFRNPRRVQQNGRSTIVVDYAGNPQAKTHDAFETIMRDVVGTVSIDESDRVLVQAQGQFLNDFKLGGGLLADVHKGSSFGFRATRVAEGVWLPANVDGEGTARILLFAKFNGRLHLTTSDYRRFHASATIVGSHGVIGSDGQPLKPQDSNEKPAIPESPVVSPSPH